MIIFSVKWIYDKPTWTIREAMKNLAGNIYSEKAETSRTYCAPLGKFPQKTETECSLRNVMF
jgi:hypothetical protein